MNYRVKCERETILSSLITITSIRLLNMLQKPPGLNLER